MKRRFVQTISLLILHSSWGPQIKWICTPVLSCHSCVLSWFACPIGVFVHFAGYHTFPFLALGIILLLGVLLGRLLCGWACPFGFLQDLLYKIPSRKISLPHWADNIKYFVLIIMVLLLPFIFGEETWYSFCRICPASALQVSLPSLISSQFNNISVGTIVRFAFLFIIITLAILCSRSFCRTICPIGALLAPLNYISFWTIKIPQDKCISCKRCDKICITDVEPSKRIIENIAPNRELDCVVCHDCKSACEQINSKINSTES